MSHRTLLPLLTLSTALLLAPPSNAAVVCVSSGPQLQSALNQAEANGEIDEIRLKPGLYFATPLATGEASFDYQSTEPLILFGATVDGSNNCTAVPSRADQSVLSGTNQFPVLRIGASAGATGAWRVSHLTITNALATQFNVGGLDLRARTNSAAILSAINLIIRNCDNNAQANPQPSALSAYNEDPDSSIRVIGSVISNNRSTEFTPILLTGSIGTSISFSNNTIAFNWADAARMPGQAIEYPVSTGGSLSLFLSNNVFHGNVKGTDQVAADLYANTQFVSLQMDHNHINVLAASNVVDAFRTQGDPRFVSDADLRLRVNSPLRNSGNNTPQGGAWNVDLDVGPRLQGSALDRGAFEFSELLINGFE